MAFSVLCVLYTFLVSFYKCSTVITRNMIRMPQHFSHPPAGSTFSGDYFLKPERLVSRLNDSDYKFIQPLKKEEENYFPNHTRPLNVVDNKTDIENIFSKLNSTETPLDSTSSRENLNKVKSTTHFVESRREPSEEPKLTISPKELSRKYWGQYKNFSNEFFNKSKLFDFSEDMIQRQYPQTNMLEILQGLFSCFWTSGLTSCLQDVFGNTTNENFPYLHYLTSRLPRLRPEVGFYEEDNESRNDELDLMVNDEPDEGRKRLSKKLQMILPFLLMLKMSMLPALAVMALVSGKAFLISLLSLGVALLTASMPASLLGANKRHEVVPQSITSPDQLHSKYYYVM